ncbi:uncharacterized protein LOC122512177 [Leptopilina heterotoma]|uniref:uncharacterized protein LOC122512177 n=1 Tax=Leptopilina heterotoma TaxID=63436 RepID=UPI001CA89411|nr:uncharacterized protein LOC122512177 [Leptopilina heterotoma]
MSLENCNKDISYAINTCRGIASILGLWPNQYEKSVLKRSFKFMMNVTSLLLMTFIIVSCILFAIFELKDISEKVMLTGPTSFYVMALMKYSVLLMRSRDIENCFKFIEKDWQCAESIEQREIMLKHAKFGRVITILCAIFMYLGGFWYSVLSPLTTEPIVTHCNISVQPFPSPISGKYLTCGLSPIYEILYALILFSVFIMYSIAVVTFGFAAVLTIHACGQFEIVIIYLNDLVSGLEKEKNPDLHEKLIVTVNFHLRVLSFVSRLESALNEICFIEFLGSTLNICLLGYYTIMGWKNEEFTAIITFSTLLASFLFNIFIYCLIGEFLTMQRTKLSKRVFCLKLQYDSVSEVIMFRKSNRDSVRLYESDYAINSCKPIALIVGLWPIHFQNSPSGKVISIILNFAAILFMMFRFTSNILYGIGEKIEKCFKVLEEDWCRIENDEQRDVMMKNAHFGRYITVICTIFIYLGGFGYNVLIPLMSGSIITHLNISVKPFPSPVYGKFLKSGISPIYEIVFGSQILSAFFLYSVTPVAFSFVAVLTMHACGQFEIVTLYLNNLYNKFQDEKNSVHEKFIILVNSHLRVLSFVAKLEAVFTEICFIEIMGCSIDLCMLGYYLIMCAKQSNYSNLITFSFLFASFLFNIFIYCYIGELLTHQAKKVGETSYMIDWHLLPKRTSKDLLFFLRCAQSSTKIKAGKVITLSFSTFGSVIRSAGAYCNALWNMTK